MRKQKGFSLIELLIVVAIILIIAAIAVPNLMRARIAANESAAVGNLRTINTAEASYISMFPNAGYTPTITELQTPTAGCPTPLSTAACLIDATLAAATTSANQKSGYYFTLAADTTFGYSLKATPTSANTGVKNFYTDSTAVIHFKNSADAGPADPAI